MEKQSGSVQRFKKPHTSEIHHFMSFLICISFGQFLTSHCAQPRNCLVYNPCKNHTLSLVQYTMIFVWLKQTRYNILIGKL